MIAGKRFCAGCGQPLPVAAAPPQSPAELAAPVCEQCGAALTPGKRFCKQCGHIAGGAAVEAEATPLGESLPAAEAALAEDQPETAVEEDLPEDTEEGEGGEEEEETDPIADGPAPEVEPEMAPLEELHAEEFPASKWERVEQTVPLPAVASSAAFTPAPQVKPKVKIGWAVSIAAAVLVAAGGGWAWYAHAHRPVSTAGGSAAPASQSAAPLLPQEQASATPETTAPAAKPSAGSAGGAVAEAPRALAQPAPQKNSAPAMPPPRPSSFGHTNPAAPTPVFQKPPIAPLPAQPAQARSGVLHYQGPPVPHGGTVVFDHLPKARLKFTFDHAAWQLIIKPNPDGTKKVILSSLAPGYQSNCELAWEIVE